MKAEIMILPFSKLLENGWELEKTLYTKKFCIYNSYPTVYYLPHSDKVCKNYSQKTFLTTVKIDLKP
jgi:hypothetical protein